MKKNIILIVLLTVFSVVGCTSTKVVRVDRDEKIDLSGKWNDYDAYLVSEELITDCINARWLGNYVDNKGRLPRLIVGHVKNSTDEQINTEVITKSIEKELINSGRVVFVASPIERGQIRDERDDQLLGFTDPETIKQHGKEVGADMMVIGSINSVKDILKGKTAIVYQVNLEVIDISTNEKLWIGQSELKKSIKVSKFNL